MWHHVYNIYEDDASFVHIRFGTSCGAHEECGESLFCANWDSFEYESDILPSDHVQSPQPQNNENLPFVRSRAAELQSKTLHWKSLHPTPYNLIHDSTPHNVIQDSKLEITRPHTLHPTPNKLAPELGKLNLTCAPQGTLGNASRSCLLAML